MDATRQADAYYGKADYGARTLRAWVEERQNVRQMESAESGIALLTFGVEVEFKAVRPF